MGKVIGERERLLREQRERDAAPVRPNPRLSVVAKSPPVRGAPLRINTPVAPAKPVAKVKRKEKPKKARKVAKAKPVGKIKLSPRSTVTPAGSFDKGAYQKTYMRDKRAADKIGLTVKEYRAKPGYTAESGLPA